MTLLKEKKRFATFIGYCGLLIWTMAASLMAFVKDIPAFQLLSIAFGSSFLATVIYLSIAKEWHTLKQPLVMWISGVFGLLFTNVFYVYSFKNAPPEQADLIIYLWPIFVVLFSGFLPREKFSSKYIIASIIGFFGCYLLITEGNGFSGFRMEYATGYLFALLAAVSWSSYTLISRHYGKTPIEAIGIYCGFCMLICSITHHHIETSIALSWIQYVLLFFMGLTVYGLAYLFWDFGIGRGHFKLLSILSYGNPVFSIGFLVFFGFSKLSLWLFIAAALVVVAGLVATLSWDWLLDFTLLRPYSWRKSSRPE